jgi:lipoprotein-anchoring transpeptidase ErfK/SrfK
VSHGSVRPRYDRIAAAGTSLAVTCITLLGGVGALPSGASAAAAQRSAAGPRAELATVTIPDVPPTVTRNREATQDPPLPEDSGSGRRVVFDIGDQRVWLVDRSGSVRRTYLASGSVYDNLRPGTFEVFSRSRHAVGISDSGVMEYFVRFTRGERAAIGFHSIPTKNGRPLQTRAELGTPRSHGCIRQALPDARRLWAFAPVGTKVVVTP